MVSPLYVDVKIFVRHRATPKRRATACATTSCSRSAQAAEGVGYADGDQPDAAEAKGSSDGKEMNRQQPESARTISLKPAHVARRELRASTSAARLPDCLDELSRALGDEFRLTFGERLEVNEVCADAERAGSGSYEVSRVPERHTARRDQL